jgi:hypothetical protein
MDLSSLLKITISPYHKTLHIYKLYAYNLLCTLCIYKVTQQSSHPRREHFIVDWIKTESYGMSTGPYLLPYMQTFKLGGA